MHPALAQAEFLTSATDARGWPPDNCPEVAIAGRSNAGKSSALNAITQRRQLARVSKTPGRTQLINFFALGEQGRLADLPGYGFAQVPLEVKRTWAVMIEGYLRARRCLCGIVLVMDARHPLTEFDRQMLDWAASIGLPCHLLLNKADKLSRNQASQQLAAVRKDLPPNVSVQLFSALTDQGVEETRAKLLEWLGISG
ncbi:MAG: ribosome biogenesis GTP-binding protein YihA/YsxC [Nevskiales bacterium]